MTPRLHGLHLILTSNLEAKSSWVKFNSKHGSVVTKSAILRSLFSSLENSPISLVLSKSRVINNCYRMKKLRHIGKISRLVIVVCSVTTFQSFDFNIAKSISVLKILTLFKLVSCSFLYEPLLYLTVYMKIEVVSTVKRVKIQKEEDNIQYSYCKRT